MKRINYIILMCLIFLSGLSYAQKKITGKIYDKNTNEPLIGASIYVPGTTTGAITNIKGDFKLKIDKKADTLEVSYLGYQKKTIVIGSKRNFNIALQPLQTSLNRVVVSASRNAKARVDAPMAISTISSLTIKDTKATQLDALLNQSAGVYMVDLGNEQHTMVIRQPLGFNDYYLYMEDGIPLRPTGDFNHNGLIEANNAATQKIEVIKGPASSIYGSEAIGGAINFITKKPSLQPEATIEAEMGNFGYKRTNLSASTTIKNFGVMAAGYYANRDEADDIHNDFHKYALTAKANYDFNEHTSLTSALDYIDYYADMGGDLDSAQFFDDDYINNPTSNQRFTNRTVNALRGRLSLNHNGKNNHTQFSLYYRDNSIGQNPSYREGYTSNPLKATGQISDNSFNSYGALVQHDQKFKWLSADWIVGLNGEYSPTTYNANFIWIDKTPDGVYYQFQKTDSTLVDYAANLYNSAAYTQLELEPIKHLRAVLGVRYDRLAYTFTNHLMPSAVTGPADTSNNYEHITPKVGFTYDLGKGNGLYVNYSVGFSPPNVHTLYGGYSVPSLKPSTFYNYEIGGWVNLANKGFAELAVYRMDGVNEFVHVRDKNGRSKTENSGKTQHQGIELSIHYSPVKDVFFQFGGTYVQHKYVEFIDGENDVSGNYMWGAPPYILNAKVTYKPQFFKGFRISLEWQSLGKYYTDAENKYTYDGFNVFNARLGYKYKGFEIWFNCINLANKVYATVVEYNYGKNRYTPGRLRTFNVGIGYHFSKKKHK